MSKFSLGNGFISHTIDIPQHHQHQEKSVANDKEPNYYPQIYMDLENLRAKRKQEMECFKGKAIPTFDKSKIKEVRTISQASIPEKTKQEMKDESMQIYNIDKSCQVTPHCANIVNNPRTNIDVNKARNQMEPPSISTIKKSGNQTQVETTKAIEITNPKIMHNDQDDLISTCRHSQSKCIISQDDKAKKPKDKENVDSTQCKYKHSENKHSKSHYSKIIAEKNENIELLRGTLLKSVKIIKKLLTELKTYNKTGKIQQEAANFLADEEVSDGQNIDYNEISAFLEDVNQSKLLEANYPLQIKEKVNVERNPTVNAQEVTRKSKQSDPLKKSNKKDSVSKSKMLSLPDNEMSLDGMLITFKKGEPISTIEKHDNAIEDLLAKTDDSQSIIESLSEQLGDSIGDEEIDKQCDI